jgi:hypothetical protein
MNPANTNSPDDKSPPQNELTIPGGNTENVESRTGTGHYVTPTWPGSVLDADITHNTSASNLTPLNFPDLDPAMVLTILNSSPLEAWRRTEELTYEGIEGSERPNPRDGIEKAIVDGDIGQPYGSWQARLSGFEAETSLGKMHIYELSGNYSIGPFSCGRGCTHDHYESDNWDFDRLFVFKFTSGEVLIASSDGGGAILYADLGQPAVTLNNPPSGSQWRDIAAAYEKIFGHCSERFGEPC